MYTQCKQIYNYLLYIVRSKISKRVNGINASCNSFDIIQIKFLPAEQY